MIESSLEIEKAIGNEVFYTDTPGIGGKLKSEPEDFIVDEISIKPEPSPGGQYTVATVKARNWEMNRLVRQLARHLRISRQRIHFAGTKDKRAISTQLMCFEKLAPEELAKIRVPDVEITNIYATNRPLAIGDLIGNSFDITLRNAGNDKDLLLKTVGENVAALSKLCGFPNFFGIQRFGAVRPITHLVGKYIVMGDLERAVFTYAANPLPGDQEESRKARAFLEETRDFKEALKVYPEELSFERTMIHYLALHPGNFAGAIMELPKNLSMMFVHSYQSYMFNRTLSERIRRGLPLSEPIIGDLALPVDKSRLPTHDKWIEVTEDNIVKMTKAVKNGDAYISGLVFGTDAAFAKGEQGEIERKIVESEKLQPNNFIIPQIQELSSRGMRRELLAHLDFNEFKCEIEENGGGDGENDAQLSLRFKFNLHRGCYATSLLREFMKTGVMDY